MDKAKSEKSLMIETKNTVGVMADVAVALAEKGVNMKGVCGWAEGDTGHVMLLTDQNQKASEALKAKNYSVKEMDVVTVEAPHKVGALKEAAGKLKSAGVNIQFIYATAGSGAQKSLVVFSASDNSKALKALNG